MATSVKVDDRTKDLLERLQAEIRLETGERVTQQELLRRITEHGFESRDELVASFRDEWDGLTEAETEQWLSGTISSGTETDEDDIDEILYG
ncbi:hypothetical protein [Haloarchaeobius litoreus]|uniref:Ribbon-helix-helix protein, copG family n=1 Tax=Haloarchaeobius litoreus TaxID=755306 RepID=A0ABD6DLI5_9EURY|nr:hypothetical protein [Haloarchaeobius litoreus]